MKKIMSFVLLVAVIIIPTIVLAESISREQSTVIMSECKSFREQAIRPLREAEIEHCVTEQGKELAWCTRFHRDHGETYTNTKGYLQIGLFWDSPVCEKALDLEKYLRVYPSKKTYQYDG